MIPRLGFIENRRAQRERRTEETAQGIRTCTCCGSIKPLRDFYQKDFWRQKFFSECKSCWRSRVLSKNGIRLSSNEGAMAIIERPCQICGEPIARASKYTCSAECAGKFRSNSRKIKNLRQQSDQQWPAWMHYEKPFLRLNSDPGDYLTQLSSRPCQICGGPIARDSKYACSKSCAAEFRRRMHLKRIGPPPAELSTNQDKPWPAWMYDKRPFLQQDVDPGDGVLLRMPGPDPERFRGLLGSSAGYSSDARSKVR